jgi:hypothetical protein
VLDWLVDYVELWACDIGCDVRSAIWADFGCRLSFGQITSGTRSFRARAIWGRFGALARFAARRGRSAKAGQCSLGFGLPLGPAKSFRRRRIPARRFGVLAGFLLPPRQFECDHGIASLFVKFGQLCCCVRTCFRLADARLDLPPVCHCRAL